MHEQHAYDDTLEKGETMRSVVAFGNGKRNRVALNLRALALAFVLGVLVLSTGGCQSWRTPGETSAEARRRRDRIVRANTEQMVADMEAVMMVIDERSRTRIVMGIPVRGLIVTSRSLPPLCFGYLSLVVRTTLAIVSGLSSVSTGSCGLLTSVTCSVSSLTPAPVRPDVGITGTPSISSSLSTSI